LGFVWEFTPGKREDFLQGWKLYTVDFNLQVTSTFSPSFKVFKRKKSCSFQVFAVDYSIEKNK